MDGKIEGLIEAATPDQIERANQAVEANLVDGSPKYDSAQGYACALTAIVLSDAATVGDAEVEAVAEAIKRAAFDEGGTLRRDIGFLTVRPDTAARAAIAALRSTGSSDTNELGA